MPIMYKKVNKYQPEDAAQSGLEADEQTVLHGLNFMFKDNISVLHTGYEFDICSDLSVAQNLVILLCCYGCSVLTV
jgi:hypothetical protein